MEAYKALEEIHQNGKIRALGLSNFNPKEYQELVDNGLTVPPVCNQIEVSPVMYRPTLIEFFTEKNILITAFKPLNRASVLDNPVLLDAATAYEVTPAQIMLRWAVQKCLIVASKTSKLSRMKDNRDILGFIISDEFMAKLDALTTPEAVAKREEHEQKSKLNL